MSNVLKPLAVALVLIPLTAMAQFTDNKIKIGILTDMSSIYSDFSGKGSVEAAKMAIEDLGGSIDGQPVEIVFADHQNKVDVGLAIARKWFDTDSVDLIMDVPQSAVALAVADLAHKQGKAAIFSSAGTSALTGAKCTPNTISWTLDTWSYATNTARKVVENEGDTWFILSVDYELGNALSKDITSAVTAAGGKIVGSVRHPINTQDFSSFLLQAQASKAKIIALANAGADNLNATKQSAEFGITKGGQNLAGVFTNLPNVKALGLNVAQGMYLSTTWYWDHDDATRAFAKRLAKRNNGVYPEAPHAGIYSALLHYAKAISKIHTDDGTKVIAAMKEISTDDPLFGQGRVRADGRAIHPIYLMQVKTPSESKYEYDFYKQISVTPAEQAFEPMDQGHCPMVAKKL